MTIRIRRANTSNPVHLDAIVALHRECFAHLDLELFKTGTWWLAYDGAAPVGFCGLARSKRWSNVGYLSRAGVAESHRGRGLQKRLIKVRCVHAKRLGWVSVITDTTKNPPSTNSLISCGFRMYAPARPWGSRTTSYWKKDLT